MLRYCPSRRWSDVVGRCFCGAAVVWALDEQEISRALDYAPDHGGIWEVYSEEFATGDAVEEGVLRMRARPAASDGLPLWKLHHCDEQRS